MFLTAAMIGAAALGLLAGHSAVDPELALLLRFMAGVKAMMAVAAGALAAWRFGHPVRPAVGMGYVVAVSGMAAGAALIWQLEHVAVGAVMVHGGLATLAILGWLDRAGWARGVYAMPLRLTRKNWPRAAVSPPPRGTVCQPLRSHPIGAETSGNPVAPFI